MTVHFTEVTQTPTSGFGIGPTFDICSLGERKMNLLDSDRALSSGIYTQTSGYSPLHKYTVDPTGSLASTPPLKMQVRFSSVAQSCPTPTPWTAAHQASLSITNSWS